MPWRLWSLCRVMPVQIQANASLAYGCHQCLLRKALPTASLLRLACSTTDGVLWSSELQGPLSNWVGIVMIRLVLSAKHARQSPGF